MVDAPGVRPYMFKHDKGLLHYSLSLDSLKFLMIMVVKFNFSAL